MGNTKIRIRKDDKVKILTGKDKGKISKVLKVIQKSNRVVVENINVVKVHQKPTQASPQGGIVEKSMPVEISNITSSSVPAGLGVTTTSPLISKSIVNESVLASADVVITSPPITVNVSDDVSAVAVPVSPITIPKALPPIVVVITHSKTFVVSL